MIPEYKRYHGAVFAELIDEFPGAITIEEWPEKGRLSCYVLNGRIGLHVKHSGSRMRPWLFTVTPSNFQDIDQLRTRCSQVFVVLVCWLDGMVCIDDAEFRMIVSQDPGRSWLRAERKKGQHYSISGGQMELRGKRSGGVAPIVHALGEAQASTSAQYTCGSPRTPSAWIKRLLGRL